jgi:hypothetical protein
VSNSGVWGIDREYFEKVYGYKMQRPLTSASNLFRRLLCPGSARMENGLPDIKSKEAEEGARLHLYRQHPEYERRLLTSKEQDLLRSADKLEDEVLDVLRLKQELQDIMVTISRERFLEDDLISGHPDVLYVFPDTSLIIETKFGWHQVPTADVNLQTRCYAVLAPTLNVFTAILQPRLSYSDRITLAKYGPEHKTAARVQIAEILKRSDDPNAPLNPSEEACRYCRARMICPALRNAVTKQLAGFEDLSVEVNPELSKAHVTSIIEARLSQATDKELGLFHRACGMARVANDPVNDEIRRRISNGGMEGYTLSKEVDVREIANTPRAVTLLNLSRILTREEALELCTLSISKVEEAHRRKNDVSAKVAKQDIDKKLEMVIDRQKRKPRIIPPK